MFANPQRQGPSFTVAYNVSTQFEKRNHDRIYIIFSPSHSKACPTSFDSEQVQTFAYSKGFVNGKNLDCSDAEPVRVQNVTGTLAVIARARCMH